MHLKKKLKYARNGWGSTECAFSCELLKGLDESKKVISRFRLLASKKCTCLTIKEKSEQFEQQKGKKCRFGVYVNDVFITVRKQLSSRRGYDYGCEIYKNDKFTCKACKTTVFLC